MVGETEPRCSARTKGGNPCAARPRPGTDRCPWHDASLAGKRSEWSRQGGRGKSNAARAKRQAPLNVLTPLELQAVLSSSIAKVLGGGIEPGVANAVAGLARALISAREATEVEERLAALEAAAGIEARSA